MGDTGQSPRDAEERFRLLADGAPVLIWVSDERNQGTYFSRPWLEFTGRSLEQELGFGWVESVHPEDRQRAAEYCDAHFRRREPFRMEFRLRRHDGQYRWMLDTGVPRFAPDGRLLGYVGSCVDITDRKNAEFALVMQARTLESMREGVSVADEAGFIVYTNPAEDRMFGYAPGELIGQHVTVQNTYPPEVNRRIVAEVIEQLKARGEWTGEWENVRKDGTPFVTSARITALVHEGRNYWVCVQEDVTDRKHADARERLLEDATRALASSLDYDATLASLARSVVPAVADWCSVDLLEETDDGEPSVRQVAIAHVDPQKVEWARALRAKYPPDPNAPSGVWQVIRTGTSDFYPVIEPALLERGAHDAEHLAMLRQVGLTSAIVAPLVTRGRTIGALTLVSAESARRFTREDLALAEEIGRRAAVAVDNARLFRDAQAARERADEARRFAESASQSKSEFLATMSHEIRTPINAIIGYAQLLSMGIAGAVNEEQARQLDRIDASGRHLLGLIDDVLDLSKIEAGRITIEPAPHVTAAAVDAALALIRPQATAKGLALSVQCEGERNAGYRGDERRVEQILVNLLSNAVKFTPPGGRVSVRCETAPATARDAGGEAPDGWTSIVVEDSGVGIAPEMQQRIFQPFVQGEHGYTRAHGGTGLGLTISRRLARLMAGDLTVESVQGEGSQFTLVLPRAARVPRPTPLVSAAIARSVAGAGPTTPAVRAEIAAAGRRLVGELDDVTRRFVRAVRDDAAHFPIASRLGDEQIEDHVQTWLADVAQALVALGSSDGDPSELMRDGTDIRRVVAERHGAQRHRLGWDESMLSREYELLRDVLADTPAAAGASTHAADTVRTVIETALQRSEEISLRALRAMVRASGGRKPVTKS